MDFNGPTFGTIKQRLAWLDQRQQVLARNIANADTPGFVPHDLQPLKEGKLAAPAPVGMAMTAPGHIAGVSRPEETFRELRQPDGDPSPSGNAVDLEAQMARLNETGISHRTATQLYRKYLGMIRTAANARG